MVILFLPNGIGDTLMALPLLRRLIAVHGLGNVTFVGSSRLHGQILDDFIGERVKTIERYDGAPLPHLRLFLKLLFTRNATIYAPMLSRRPFHLLFFLLLGKRTLVPGSFLKRNLLRLARAPHSLESFDGHQVDYFVQFLSQWEPHLDRNPVQPEELAPRALPQAGPDPVHRGQRYRLALGISCGKLEKHKIPTPQAFARLVRAIAGRIEVEVILIGLSSDDELMAAFATELGQAAPLERVVGLPILELIDLLRTCDLGISGTTGQGHMMAAAGLPVLVVSGVTAPSESGPYARRGAMLRHRYPCGPCYQEGFRHGCQKIRCMESLDLEEGSSLALRLLTEPGFGMDWLRNEPKEFPITVKKIMELQSLLPKEPSN